MHSSHPLRILLVEDDDGDAKALQRSFQKANLANPIHRALDGLEALDMLRGENGKTKVPVPHILIVDLNMPRMNGIQLLEAIRADQQLRQTVIFILTTSKRPDDKNAAYDLNVAGYIVKETAGKDFMSFVDLMVNYWGIVEMP